MYDIYIKNYQCKCCVDTEEQLLYRIPINPEEELALIEPKVKTEMGKTGSFEFGVYPNHPFYSSWLQMKTIMRVVYDGDTLFRGRVLTIDNQPMTGSRKLHLEGDMAFLMDSVQEGTKEEKRDDILLSVYLQRLIRIHNNQMAESGDDDKKFWLGEVPGNYTSKTTDAQRIQDDTKKYGSNSWESTWNALETLQKDHGGYFRTRYVEEKYVDTIGRYGQGNIDLNNRIVVHNPDGSISTERSFSTNIDEHEVLLPTVVNGVIVSEEDAIDHYDQTGEYLGIFDTVDEAEAYADALHDRQDWYYHGKPIVKRCYLDWLEYYFDAATNKQPIEVTENLIELDSSTEVDNIFTALIPIGSKKGEGLFLDGYEPDGWTARTGKEIYVPEIVDWYEEDELNFGYHSVSDYENAVDRYGIVYKVQEFQNADTQDKLWEYAMDWIRLNYNGGLENFTISALDMHHIDGAEQKYLSGDRVEVSFPKMDRCPNSESIIDTRIMTIVSAEYVLHNPEKNRYSVGIPNSLLNKKYGQASGKGGGGGGASNGDEKQNKLLKEVSDRVHSVEDCAWDYVISGKFNNDMYQDLVKTNPETADKAVMMSYGTVQRALYLREDPEGKYAAWFTNGLSAMDVDGFLGRVRFSSYMPEALVNELKDRKELIKDVNTSITLDGYVGSMTMEERLNYRGGSIISDEALAEYLTYAASGKRKLMELTIEDDDGQGDFTAQRPKFKLRSVIPGTATDKDPWGIKSAEDKNGVTADGFNGFLGNMLSATGSDGTGEKPSVVTDGVNGVQELLDGVTNTDDADAMQKNLKEMLEVPGADLGTEVSKITGVNLFNTGKNGGEVGVGKKDSAETDSRNWKVNINRPVTYTVEDPETGDIVTRTLNKTGLVSADDVYIPEIGSFHTKFAVIDDLVATKASIEQLKVVEAKIDDLSAITITTENLRSEIANVQLLSIRSMQATGTVEAHTLFGDNLYVVGYGGSARWISASLTDSDGNPKTIYYLGHY